MVTVAGLSEESVHRGAAVWASERRWMPCILGSVSYWFIRGRGLIANRFRNLLKILPCTLNNHINPLASCNHDIGTVLWVPGQSIKYQYDMFPHLQARTMAEFHIPSHKANQSR